MYVYLLQSIAYPNKKYIGLTHDLKRRLEEHNARKCESTAKYAPWRIVTSIWFDNQRKAEKFEVYLKRGSGHSFAKRHFW